VGNEKDAGKRVTLELMRRGMIVRPLANYGLPQWLRVTVGSPEQIERFLSDLTAVIGLACPAA
jgi:histidinol-phosphate aminotransferase